MLTNSCGANCSTNAMMPMSAPSFFIASPAAGDFRLWNWNTCTPLSCAATFSASGRAPGFSGAQNTPATWSPRVRKASSTPLPKSCWPIRTILISRSRASLRGLLRRHAEGAGAAQVLDLRLVVAEHLAQHFVGVLAKRRRALDERGRFGELDRHADVEPLAALRMVELDPHLAATHVLVGREVLRAHDRAAGYVERIEDRHELPLAVVLGELVDQRPHQVLVLAPVGDLGEARIGGHVGHADLRSDALGEVFPHRLLHNDVQPVIGAVRLAVHGIAELPAARVVSGARHLAHPLVCRNRILGQIAPRKALVVAELHAAKVHHAIHHRHLDVLALAGLLCLAQRREQADGEMQPGARVADLRAGDERRAVRHAGGAHRPAHRLRNVFIRLEVRVRSGGAETLDRAHDNLRIDLADLLPGKAEALEHAWAEVLHDDVALLQEVDEYLLALARLHVDGDRALVAVEHREVERVGVRHVAQLAAGRIPLRILELDDVGAHPREQLRAGWPGLHVRHVENSYALQCFHFALRYFFFAAEGLRLVMRPLSVPAVSSITALMRVGFLERSASSIAFLSSLGVVACTPTPPKASISLS